MIEIKFRAWYEEEKEMQSVIDIYFNKNKGDIESFVTKGKKATYHTDVHTHKLMQYTGLKDKNGVEIYEGDILSGWIGSHWHSGEDKFEEVVKYDEKTASYNFAAIEVRYGDLEVIGNIYENKQLKELINFGTTTK